MDGLLAAQEKLIAQFEGGKMKSLKTDCILVLEAKLIIKLKQN